MKFLAIALLLASHSIWAQTSEDYEKGFKAGQEAAKKKKKLESQVEVEVETEPTLRDKLTQQTPVLPKNEPYYSQEIRREKSYEVALSWGADYRAVTNQLILSKYLKSDQVVGFKIGYGKDDNGDDEITQFNITLNYKEFFSNSFYVSPEITYLRFDEIDTENDFFSDEDEFYRGGGIGVRIGNQWHGKNFTIGCDWIGIGKLVFSTRNNGDFENYATLLNTYIGYSF